MKLETVEKIATIISLLATPLIVATFGASIQDKISNRSNDTAYTELAISILRDNELSNSGVGQELRKWAIDVLDKTAPVKLPTTVRFNLITDDLFGNMRCGKLYIGENGYGKIIGPAESERAFDEAESKADKSGQ